MCVTVYQIVGYSVPYKKVQLVKQNISNYSDILKGFSTFELNNKQTIYIIHLQESTCECGDEEGDGRRFERDTFEPLIYDEDDMQLKEQRKQMLLSKLKEVGLDKHATYGVYTTTEIDGH